VSEGRWMSISLASYATEKNTLKKNNNTKIQKTSLNSEEKKKYNYIILKIILIYYARFQASLVISKSKKNCHEIKYDFSQKKMN
jgi:hypothetical protein